MKWLLSIVVSLLAVQMLAAQEYKQFQAKQLCAPWERLTRILDMRGEDILFTADGMQTDLGGNSFKSGMIFQVNQNTGTWSLVSFYGDGMACLVADGFEFRPYSK